MWDYLDLMLNLILIRTKFDCIILDSCDACEANLIGLFDAIQEDELLLDKMDDAIVDAMDCDGETKNPLCVRETTVDFWYEIGQKVIFTEDEAKHMCSTLKDMGACRYSWIQSAKGAYTI